VSYFGLIDQCITDPKGHPPSSVTASSLAVRAAEVMPNAPSTTQYEGKGRYQARNGDRGQGGSRRRQLHCE
jgi:hypothetical protein